MNKYSYLALGMALLIGITLGSFFYYNKAKKELYQIEEQHRLKLEQQNKNSRHKVDSITTIILKYDSADILDSLKIIELQDGVRVANQNTEKLRQEAKKLNSNEKANWIVSRYTTKH